MIASYTAFTVHGPKGNILSLLESEIVILDNESYMLNAEC